MKQQLILLCFLNLFISCKKEIVDANRVIDIVPFEQIELNDAFELFVTEGDHYSIEIFGDEKIIDYVDVNVKDKTLIIEDSRGIKWLSPKKNKIKIYVTSLPLKEITAAEGCNIETLNAITSLEFGLILTGKSNEAKTRNKGGVVQCNVHCARKRK